MPTPSKLLLDAATADQIRKLFDELLLFMGDTYVNSNVFATIDSSGTNCGVNATDKLGNTFTYNERITGPRISLAPAGAALGPGETQQFTATVTNSDGSAVPTPNVQWYLSDPTVGSVDATGLYTAPAVIAGDLQNLLHAKYVDGGSQVTATIILHP